jgi:hypothetical protein
MVDRGKVYVVHNNWLQNPETGEMPYKIGITQASVNDRYYGLGLKMPGEFVCDFAYEFEDKYNDIEKMLHDILSLKNVNGEWFAIDEKTREGIKKNCELLGGKLVTQEIEREIEAVSGNEINADLGKIVEKWNSNSNNLPTAGNAVNYRNIRIPGINNGLHYAFTVKGRDIAIELGCSTIAYPNLSETFKQFADLRINEYYFDYCPPTDNEIKRGWTAGLVSALIPITKINDAVDTMQQFILVTKGEIIKACNR